MEFIKRSWKGIAVCFGIAMPSWWLGQLIPIIGGPVFAILFGMIAAHFIQKNGALSTGIQFTSKKILQLAVILLGFGMNLTDVLSKGIQSLPIIITTIATSLIIAMIVFKLLNVPEKTSILVGVGTSICGGSAIAATAPVIGASDEEIAQSISVIFLFNVSQQCYSILDALGLSNEALVFLQGRP